LPNTQHDRSGRKRGRTQDLRVIGLRAVASKVDLHPDSVMRLVRQNRFPPPFKKTPGGRDNCWFAHSIDDYLMERAGEV